MAVKQTNPARSDQKARRFYGPLLKWFDVHGRKDLPWQNPRTPYAVWVSEIMLQQTQVVTVLRYFEPFMQAFPDVQTLAQATLDQVLAKWSGLGYYARARNLWKSAQIICETQAGALPTTLAAWTALPGVGRSTAGAILAQSFNQRVPILDGNVKRVLSRYFAFNGCIDDPKAQNALWDLSTALLPSTRLADYTQALMDLGATVCTKTKPRCSECPLQQHCAAFLSKTVSRYPIRRIKKALPTQKVKVWVIVNTRQQIWLVQRKMSGIWGGLWSLPEAIEATYKADCQPLPLLLHTFTHFKLQIAPYLLQSVENFSLSEGRWFYFHEIFNEGLPAPIRKILENVQELLCQPCFVEN